MDGTKIYSSPKGWTDGDLNGRHENNPPKHGELNDKHKNKSPKGWTG